MQRIVALRPQRAAYLRAAHAGSGWGRAQPHHIAFLSALALRKNRLLRARRVGLFRASKNLVKTYTPGLTADSSAPCVHLDVR
jgi:uncharacterized protein YcaQ